MPSACGKAMQNPLVGRGASWEGSGVEVRAGLDNSNRLPAVKTSLSTEAEAKLKAAVGAAKKAEVQV
jgi:hypothetical protein